MNEEAAHKSHTTSWVLGMLGALLVYVATWPIVVIKTSHFTVHKSSYFRQRPFWWTQTLYQPLDYLTNTDWAGDPLQSYFNWWMVRLAQPV